MSNLVEINSVSKTYGKVQALDQVSLKIAPGTIAGLIGPNGAGKTTLLKSLLGLTGFQGDMIVLGQDPRVARSKIMQRVCFIADVGVLPGWLKVSNALDYVAGLQPRFNRAKAEAMLADTEIASRQKVRELSKGMVTQLHLALVLAIDVDLLVLDEPTLGLDILRRKAFYERVLNDCFDQQTSVIISTHQVEEVEELLTHLLFIDKGKIVLDCAMDAIDQQYCELLLDGPEHLAAAQALAPLHSRQVQGQQAMIFERAKQDELAKLNSLGSLRRPSVADLFVAKMQQD